MKVSIFSTVIDYIFVKDPIDTVVNAGQQLTLQCKPPRAYPTNLQITWYKDYTSLTPSSDVTILSDGSLQVNSVTKAYEGTYFCEAHNSVTSEKRTSKKAVVTVRGLFLDLLHEFLLLQLPP